MTLTDIETSAPHGHIDALTGIHNRARTLQTIDSHLADGTPVTVLYIDLNNFKQVNDTLSHASGDTILANVAARIRAAVRTTDTTGRLGGDEFCVILTAVTEPQQAVDAAHRIHTALGSNPIHINNIPLTIQASIGIALADPQADTATLINRADTAMYQAKQHGQPTVIYQPTMGSHGEQLSHIARTLHTAMTTNRVRTTLEPIINLADETIAGYEAVGTITTDTGQHLNPNNWQDVADSIGLHTQIGNIITSQALTALTQHPDTAQLALALSTAQLNEDTAAADIVAQLRTAHINPDRIMITTTAAAAASEPATRALLRMAAHGLHIYLDGAGAGHTPLEALTTLPLTGIKLDRVVVAGLGWSQTSSRLLTTISAITQASNLTVIADGITNRAQRTLLLNSGVKLGQGTLWTQQTPEETLRGQVTTGM